MDSFYGGHEGVSFVLRASFASYNDMVSAFKQGSNYTDVWFGEYCILDTPNKNHPDNGKIYQRSLDYQSDTGCAIYVGQIVGPSSGTPWFQMTTIDKVVEKSKETLDDNSYRRYPTGVDSKGNVISNWQYDTSSNSWSDVGGEIKKDFSFSTKNDTSLVPGKKDDGTYNDEIKWTWCNIRKDDEDKDSYYYVGFQIPYMVTDYSIHQTSPYDSKGEVLKDATEIARIDDKTHPFYEHWDLGLPKGIKGDTLRNLRVIVPTAADKSKIYQASAIKNNDTTGATTLGAAGYTGIDDDIAKGRKIIVFDYYVFDKLRNPSPIMIYLGDFNIITGVSVDDEGTLTIQYSHNDSSVYTRKIKWVKSLGLTTGNGKNGGLFKVDFNNKDTSYTANLTWVKNIQIQENGDVVYTYAGTDNGNIPDDGIKTVKNLVKWVSGVTLNTDTGAFEMTFNNGSNPYRTTLNWVKDITINESNGRITLNHTTGDVVSAARLKIVTNARVDATGVTTLVFNTGETLTLKAAGSNEDYHIKVIKNVILNEGIAADKHIQVQYNTGETVSIGDPVNAIAALAVRPSDWHLLVLYSDPSHRVNTATTGWVAGSNIQASWGKSIDSSYLMGDIYWEDLGAIKDQAGILIGFNVTKEDVTNAGKTDILEYLNDRFPTGLTGEQNQPGGASTKEKVITYSPKTAGSTEHDDKEFYAFDYNTNKWYYLGTIADTGIRDVVLSNIGDSSSVYNNLSTLGLAFMKANVTTSDTAIPSYWASTYKQ